MRHVSDVIKRAFIDVPQRDDEVACLRRERSHSETVGRMNVGYRVDAKFMRSHGLAATSVRSKRNA